MSARPTRRMMLAGGGLVVAFALSPRAIGQAEQNSAGQSGGGEGGGPKKVAPGEPGDLSRFPLLDSWIRIDGDGRAKVFTGKAELGQGIKTALIQLAAEELDLPPRAVTLVTADTGRTVDEGVTAGSHSMQDSGTAILNAAADVRRRLVETAAALWTLSPDALSTADASVLAPDGRRLSYGALAAGLDLHVAARPDAPRKTTDQFRLIGTNLPRVDIPAKLSGRPAYIHDMRMPGMLHARVLRGPSDGTALKPEQLDAVGRRPGVFRLVRDGRFAAVLAEREWAAVTAVQAAQALGWSRAQAPLPPDIHAWLRGAPTQDQPIFDYPGPPATSGQVVKARYTRPYLMHGSIGPSCAVALWKGDGLTVWTHSQGVFPLQRALADLFRMPADKIHCIHAEAAGCYGHNGADDVAADAALAARPVPGRPVRMQWTREQEHGWEPLGPAMVAELEATLVGPSAGAAPARIGAWSHQVWSNEHNSRPTSGGGLLAGAELDPPFPPQPQKPIPMPEGGAARNGNPLYALPHARGVFHWVQSAPVRVSALRGLGAHMNVFAIESFMDELAAAAHIDPLAFRLAHMEDARARDVMSKAAERFGWRSRRKGGAGRGCGFAFARYKNLGAYCAVALEVEVDHETGAIAVRRAVAAVDSGEAVNPDGIRNQIEGGIVQSLSWTTQESVGFDTAHRTSFDWSVYPILRFPAVPDRLEVHIINCPGQPFLGTGEAAQGPTGAAVANAVQDAVGIRLRDMPLSPERLKAAIGV